jgi:hypothetical protein
LEIVLEVIMDKALLVVAALAGASVLGAGSSRAYEGAWCAVQSTGLESVSERCHFRSFEACRREVVSGNIGFCRPSQYVSERYAPPSSKARKPRKRVRD